MISTLKLMLRLARVSEETRLAAARRARGELDKVQGVVGQLEGYAREYREQLLQQAKVGTTPAHIQATLDFEQRLSQTATAQKLAVGQLENNMQQTLSAAVEARMRGKVIEKVLQKRLAQARVIATMREAREVEESIAARHMIHGMNDALK